MIVWVDAQLSPALAPWLTQEFGIEALSVRRLDLLHANTSNAHLKRVLARTFPDARRMVEAGETLIEIAELP